MANLWRVLALAWLGGIASPALTDDTATAVDVQPVAVIAESAPEQSAAGETARPVAEPTDAPIADDPNAEA
jgi:hypothetical protein